MLLKKLQAKHRKAIYPSSSLRDDKVGHEKTFEIQTTSHKRHVRRVRFILLVILLYLPHFTALQPTFKLLQYYALRANRHTPIQSYLKKNKLFIAINGERHDLKVKNLKVKQSWSKTNLYSRKFCLMKYQIWLSKIFIQVWILIIETTINFADLQHKKSILME